MLEHISFTARLRLRSDLHIGTGGTGELSKLRSSFKPDDPEKDPDVALIARDHDGRPIIPATALKGALRKAALAGYGRETAERLFGAVKYTSPDGTDETGQIGLVWLRFAPMTETPLPGERPFWDAQARTIITTHVAIERRTGTAADKKLFCVERVPEGAGFELRGVYIGTRADAESDLPLALGALAAENGLAIGADGKTGGGRIGFDNPPGRAMPALACRRRYFDAASGEVRDEGPFPIGMALPAAEANNGAAPRFRLTLSCRGPYLTIDPERPRGGNVIPAARRNSDPPTPLLPASSLIGVLRTRAAWLAATDATPDDDDPDGILVTGQDPRTLTRTQRLFGVAGWRGLVQVAKLDAENGSRAETLPSVVIDRFSGGTLDSALYMVEAFAGVRFTVTLRLDRRCWRDAATGVETEWPSDADSALFHRLLLDLQDEGVMLGHGTNRGFGWFDVEKIEPPPPNPDADLPQTSEASR
jgi:CRISPR/Cas system CSM-associated protein Csm3 (group 7 of RAMP superfamily)